MFFKSFKIKICFFMWRMAQMDLKPKAYQDIRSFCDVTLVKCFMALLLWSLAVREKNCKVYFNTCKWSKWRTHRSRKTNWSLRCENFSYNCHFITATFSRSVTLIKFVWRSWFFHKAFLFSRKETTTWPTIFRFNQS